MVLNASVTNVFTNMYGKTKRQEEPFLKISGIDTRDTASEEQLRISEASLETKRPWLSALVR
jgi:hypothetical protein